MIGEPSAIDLARLKYWNGVLRLEARTLALALKAGFRVDQPRVPAENSDGGQWTDGGPDVVRVSGRSGRPRQNNSGQLYIAGRWQNVSQAQSMIITVSYARLQQALTAIRRIDPNWKPTPQLYETVPGYVRALEWNVREAQFRLFELSGHRAGPGPFAAERVPMESGSLRPTIAQRSELDRIGRESGCHGCGTRDPGTKNGHFVGDHQAPRSVENPTFYYPQCIGCSHSQGGMLGGRKGAK